MAEGKKGGRYFDRYFGFDYYYSYHDSSILFCCGFFGSHDSSLGSSSNLAYYSFMLTKGGTVGKDIYINTDRKKSALIKELQERTGVSTKALADSIGVSVATFNNKLHRDSFSWEQMLTIISACGKDIYVK